MQYSKSIRTSNGTGKMSKTVKIIIASMMLTALAGCKAHRQHVVGYEISDPSQRHPIMVSKKADLSRSRGATRVSRSLGRTG